MPSKPELIAFVAGLALGAGPDQPIVDILMKRFGITDDEMLEATKTYLPYLSPELGRDN